MTRQYPSDTAKVSLYACTELSNNIEKGYTESAHKRRKRYSRKLAPCSKALGKTHIENTSSYRKYSINLAKQHLSVLDPPPIPPDHSSDPLSRPLTTSLIPLPTLRATYTHRFTPQICIPRSHPRTSSTIHTYLCNPFYVPPQPFIRT